MKIKGLLGEGGAKLLVKTIRGSRSIRYILKLIEFTNNGQIYIANKIDVFIKPGYRLAISLVHRKLQIA